MNATATAILCLLMAIAACERGPEPTRREVLDLPTARQIVPGFIHLKAEPRCAPHSACLDLPGGEPHGTWLARASHILKQRELVVFIVCDNIPDRFQCGWGVEEWN